MAKKVAALVKLQIPAGQANPAPPVGPALGQRGVNIMEFCKAFNAKTQGGNGMLTPVIITVYSDKSFTFITKTPPASTLLRDGRQDSKRVRAIPNKDKVGKVTRSSRCKEIAKSKMADLNAASLDAAIKMVEGTARSMGIEMSG